MASAAYERLARKVTTARVGIGGAIVGVPLGGAVQLYVGHRERQAASRGAARLLFADLWIGASAVRSLRDIESWWSKEVKPPLEDWRRYRQALAVAMWDEISRPWTRLSRIAELERWRQADAKPEDLVDGDRETAKQAHQAAGVLIRHAFSGREYRAAVREMEQWPRKSRGRPNRRKRVPDP